MGHAREKKTKALQMLAAVNLRSGAIDVQRCGVRREIGALGNMTVRNYIFDLPRSVS